MNKKPNDNELLVPWLVNGSLQKDEQERVEAWLAEQDDGEQIRALDDSIRDGVRSEQIGSPGAFGLRRLQQAIRRDAAPAKSTVANRWWRPAIAAAGLVMLVQGGMILEMMQDKGNYQPLSTDIAGFVLQIEFEPDASNRQITELLSALDASIIDGPSAAGLYRIRLQDPAADEALRDAVIARLRQAETVRFADSE